MSKKALIIAAALIAGSTLTTAANAGVRVGFGFPLGSFVAHENQSYSGRGYDRDCEPPRRAYQAAPVRRQVAQPVKRVYVAPAVAQVKPAAPAVAEVKAVEASKTAKLDTKLSDSKTNETNVTEIAKTDPDDATSEQPEVSTTAILAKAPEGATKNGASTATKEVTSLPEVVVESPKTVEKKKKVSANTDSKKSDLKTVASVSDDKKVCRRFSAAVGGLVETTCE